MNVEYVEVNEPINTEYDTYIIAYCPDFDEFFATNNRHFFWHTTQAFATAKEAIEYFEKNVPYFWSVKNEIMSGFVYDWKQDFRVWFDNTGKWYSVWKDGEQRVVDCEY